MKKLIFTIIVFLLLSSIADSQWITQYPYTAGIGLLDLKFINSNTGWICGDGLILKTTNRGINWIVQNHPASDKYLYCIHPVDSNIVYCVGWFETVLKTTDGGNNWFAIKNGPVGQGYSYEAVFFVNAYTGWYAGTGNYVHKTTNGGLTFDSVYVLGDFKDIHFKNETIGLITGGGGEVFKTTNSGETWNKIYLTPNNYGDFRKLSVINNQYCFVVEDGKRVYKSTNYGDTWDSVGFVSSAIHPYCCRFSSLNTGWVGGTYGQMFKSTDGGATWNSQYVNTTNMGYIWSFCFLNDYTGWAIGGNTKLLFTTSGGATFINNFETNIPENFKLYQNFPNPFNSNSQIKFEIIKSGHITLKIYNILGKNIEIPIDNYLKPGLYEFKFNGEKYSSGIYFYSLIYDESIKNTKSMILLK